MADWSKITSRGKVEDRRGIGALPLGGGLSIGGILLYLALSYLSGGSPADILGNLGTAQLQSASTVDTAQFEGADTYEVFTATVLGSTNDLWSGVFAEAGKTFEPPKLVLFRSATQSECGMATTDVGPFYCPLDKTIYLDETFFDELTRLGATGDVAQAYVIAHEAGHHAQDELGLLPDPQNQDNDASVRTELQADCFAGLWAYSIKDLDVLEFGEIQEAITAAKAVGDDRIQQATTGSVNPEAWTHGSSVDRAAWFSRGFEAGAPAACDTEA